MFLLALLFQIPAAPPPLDQILSRVALNQARSQQLRAAYVYNQRLAIRFRRGDGRLAREEVRDYTVTPQPRGITKTLDRCQGRYEKKGRVVAFDRVGTESGGIDLDGLLTNEFAEDFADDRDGRDGIGHDLFPLTAHQQGKYTLTFKGRETYQGGEVFRLAFRPRGSHGEWTGEALIDAAEYQPVFVRTSMAHPVPLAVRTLLGTNVRGLGFAITYARFHDVWFPVTYGGEFSLRFLFGYKRSISINLVNSGFRRTQVESTVAFTCPPCASEQSTDK
jgi:hypothetical protein